jgi:ComF family protein
VAGWIRVAVDALGATLLSPACAVCGCLLEAPTRGAVCGRCWNTIPLLTPPLCARCGYPVGGALSSAAGAGCIGCTELRNVDHARALGSYEGTLRDVLHALKYGGRRSTAAVLARLLRERCGDVLTGADAVLPVPLHLRREWSRGFNQAALVARDLGPPVRHLLRRRHHTPPQAGLTAGERRANVEGAFAPSWRALMQPTLVRGACLVLVDDVSTTGATLDACAAVLKERGAREVRALVVARTLKGGANRT